MNATKSLVNKGFEKSYIDILFISWNSFLAYNRFSHYFLLSYIFFILKQIFYNNSEVMSVEIKHFDVIQLFVIFNNNFINVLINYFIQQLVIVQFFIHHFKLNIKKRIVIFEILIKTP
jgi:hypothetical protein